MCEVPGCPRRSFFRDLLDFVSMGDQSRDFAWGRKVRHADPTSPLFLCTSRVSSGYGTGALRLSLVVVVFVVLLISSLTILTTVLFPDTLLTSPTTHKIYRC